MVSSFLKRSSSVLAAAVIEFLCAAAPKLNAQSGGTITGVISAQQAKPIAGARVTVKSETGSVSGSATTDSEGHFTVGNLAAGNYSVDTASPGFALNSRRGVQVTASASRELAITLNVDTVSQSVVVESSATLAVYSAPQGNTLDTTSAKTEISNAW